MLEETERRQMSILCVIEFPISDCLNKSELSFLPSAMVTMKFNKISVEFFIESSLYIARCC